MERVAAKWGKLRELSAILSHFRAFYDFKSENSQRFKLKVVKAGTFHLSIYPIS